MRAALVALTLALVLSAANLELIYTKSYYGRPVLKMKLKPDEYAIFYKLGDGDDVDYCCGYSYYLDDDVVSVIKVQGAGSENEVIEGKVKLGEKYEMITATNYGFVVCNAKGCAAFTRNGELLWKLPIKVNLDISTHSFIPFVNGTIYFVGKNKRELIMVNSETGRVNGIMKMDMEISSITSCENYVALTGEGNKGNDVVEFYEVEPNGTLNLNWRKVGRWVLSYSSLSDDCRYLAVASPIIVYVLDTKDGEVIASRNTYMDLVIPKGYAISSIEISPLAEDGSPAITVILSDYEYLLNALHVNSIEDILDVGNTFNHIMVYLLQETDFK